MKASGYAPEQLTQTPAEQVGGEAKQIMSRVTS